MEEEEVVDEEEDREETFGPTPHLFALAKASFSSYLIGCHFQTESS